MNLKKIDHIGILVNDIEAALDFYHGKLGLPAKPIEVVSEFRVRVAFLQIGDVTLELVEPFEDSPYRQLGEGLHHICFEVDDILGALRELKAKDVPLVDNEPRPGAEGGVVAFLEAGPANSVPLELKEFRNRGGGSETE